MNLFLRVLRLFIPYGLVAANRRFQDRGRRRQEEEARRSFHSVRAQALATVASEKLPSSDCDISYESVIAYALQLGVPEPHLREGSVPQASMEAIERCLHEQFQGHGPIYGVHVGNFVGVSLTLLTGVAKDINPMSLVVSIDPNIPHRGVSNPQNYVARLLAHFGLQLNSLILAGYSQRKSVSNDGMSFADYNSVERFRDEVGCENVLLNLGVITGRRFDFVLLDGNHEACYLQNEISACTKLMKSGALLILDDVDEHWSEIRGVFQSLDESLFTEVLVDQRIGIARFNPHEGAR